MTYANPAGDACVVCESPVAVKKWGYCWAHYMRWRKSGDPHGSGKRRRGAPLVHGVYGSYVAGCRCDECTDAMRSYRRERAAAIQRGDVDIAHGSASSYCSGCRCRRCRLAMNAAAKKKRDAKYERFRQGLLRVEHGVFRTYSEFGCRCETCSVAFRVEIRQYDGRRCRPRRQRKPRTINRSRRTVRLSDIETEARNHAFREREVADAVANADEELRELIAEQSKEARSSFQSARGASSLDAQVFEDGGSRYDFIGSEWDDPTFDAVLADA